tara:strand:+ start:111 stop:284 length:174 start_codon:yes stop_codon:yes gene_type:complete
MDIIYHETIHYLDPGTGMNIIQVLSALGITLVVYFRNFRSYLSSRLDDISKKFKKEN